MPDPRADPAAIVASGSMIAGAVGMAADPRAADWAVLAVFAIAGGYAAVALRDDPPPVMASVRIVLACAAIGTALAFTATPFVAARIGNAIHVPPVALSGACACLIALMADQLPRLKNMVFKIIGKQFK